MVPLQTLIQKLEKISNRVNDLHNDLWCKDKKDVLSYFCQNIISNVFHQTSSKEIDNIFNEINFLRAIKPLVKYAFFDKYSKNTMGEKTNTLNEWKEKATGILNDYKELLEDKESCKALYMMQEFTAASARYYQKKREIEWNKFKPWLNCSFVLASPFILRQCHNLVKMIPISTITPYLKTGGLLCGGIGLGLIISSLCKSENSQKTFCQFAFFNFFSLCSSSRVYEADLQPVITIPGSHPLDSHKSACPDRIKVADARFIRLLA